MSKTNRDIYKHAVLDLKRRKTEIPLTGCSLSSDVIKDFLFRFTFQNYRALKASGENEPEEASQVGSCIPCSVIKQILAKIEQKNVETSTYAQPVTIQNAI